MNKINRRQMLCSTGVAAAYAALGTSGRVSAAPRAEMHETKVISHLPDHYHGWPTLARRRSGQLLLVCSGGREAHVCPFGRVDLMRSDDGGGTWSWPRVVMDGPIDDRDAGVLETDQGHDPGHHVHLVGLRGSIPREGREDRAGAAGGLAGGEAEALAGGAPSGDRGRAAGRTRRVDDPVDRRRRDVVRTATTATSTAPTGRSSFPTAGCSTRARSCGRASIAWASANRPTTVRRWQWLAEIPTREGDQPKNYHELHAVEAADGRLVVQIRNHNKVNTGETLQTRIDRRREDLVDAARDRRLGPPLAPVAT